MDDGRTLDVITPRENLLTVFRHELPEWIPVTGHVDPYNQPNREGMDSRLAAALGTVGWGDGSTMVFSRYLGLDIMDFFGPPIVVKRRKVKVEKTLRDDGWITTYQTPKGELTEVHKQVRQDGTSYCQQHRVRDAGDLPALCSILEDEEFELDAAGLEALGERKAQIGDQGLIRCYMPGTPLGMMVRVYSGVETLAYLWADHRQELGQLFSVMEQNHLRRFRMAASLGYDLLYATDDTSTTAISPEMFEEFCLGYTDRVAEATRQEGARYVHHSCGHIRNLLDLYRQTKMDAVDALCIKPLGNIDSIAEAKAGLGSRITMIASVVQMVGDLADRAAAADGMARMFQDAAPGDNVIFNVVSEPDKTMEQTEFVVRQCRRHQHTFGGARPSDNSCS